MIPELGSFAIILALCFALIQSAAPFHSRQKIYLNAAVGQFIFLSIAMLCLIISFLNNDLTVIYVREHSHALLPLLYRIGAAWGGHEGSLLLWCLILSGWTFAFIFTQFSLFFAGAPSLRVSRCARKLRAAGALPIAPPSKKNENHVTFLTHTLHTKIVMVLGILNAGFMLFLLTTSNPFKRGFPTALIVGNDLTPVLQDPGLIFHPPMLYLGYVGFAVGFAFAIAALLEGKLNSTWAKACRPWIVLPWSFLSCGIVLGSWWAYRELGWGGWWFWDPVENASLLPWLSATALIHSLIVSEKRGSFQGWTLLLAIITFALSLLGTFLVRSGVLVSVHAFASDPSRGIFLLGYLALIIGGALLLYGTRIKHFYQAPNFALFSRETFMLMNSVMLLTAVITIVIGTLYPIILDALAYAKISVGEPYFNTVFLPMMLPLLLLMGFAPHVKWGEQSAKKLWRNVRLSFFAGLILAYLLPAVFGFSFHWLTWLGVFLALWIIISTVQYVWQLQNKLLLSHWAMIIAHIGIAVIALGITINKSYSTERQVKMLPGETVTLAGYQFTFAALQEMAGPNYRSVTAVFAVRKNHGAAETLLAQQRIYTSHQESLSKPGVLFNAWRDLYLALGTQFTDHSWSVRIYYKPFVRWIWAGGFLLLIGGLLSLLAYWKNNK